jgi:ATP-dependent Clp protease ATP-binding subunit ClpC
MRLTAGAEAAWMVAAGEAVSAGHPRIEPAHLLIGVLSLGKLDPGPDGSGGANAALVREENARLLRALSACGLDPMRLRRRARTQLGRGSAEAPPPGPISRSLTSKAVFAAAEALAGEDRPVGVAHLFSALAEDVDAVTARIVRQGGTDLARLRTAVLEAGRGAAGVPAAPPPGPAAAAPRTPYLDRFGRGATTVDEYRRSFELDPVLERRVEEVPAEEPDRDETLEILRGLRPRLERRHRVSLPDETLAAAVDLSARFEPDRRLPGKAIDLVDNAAARTRLPTPSLVDRPRGHADAEEAPEAPLVTPVIVARVLAEKRRLPFDLVAESLDDGMGTRLLALEGFLRERVIGQEEATARASRRLRLAFATPPGARAGPIAVLLFLGPSGVGKTETARLLGEYLFGSASGMIRIDMSELTEEHSVSKLLGSAPGRVGREEEGQLVGAMRTKPNALLLLDEVEKAHPRVLDVFLRLFGEGRLADSKGRTADGRHLVVVMTSNLGSARPGGVFRPELLDRVDEIVTFRALDPDDVEMIVGRALAELTSAMERRYGVRVRLTPEAARFAAQQAALSAPGAGGARRTVERLVSGPLSALVLTGKLTRHTAWVAVYDEGGIYLLPEG